MDPGETPWECALRECKEETGITFKGEQHLLGVHFLPPDGVWPTNHIGFIFDGGQLSEHQFTNIVLDPEEHTEVQVHALQEWRRIMTPRNFARLAAVDEARRTHTVAYLEGSVR